MLGQDLGDGGLVGLGRSGGEGERHLGEAELEEPVAAPRLAVVVALGRGTAEDFDLAIIQAEAAIDGGDLRFEGALIGEEEARRTALDDGRRDRRAVDVGQRLGGEDHRSVLLAQGLEPFAQLAGEALVVEGQPPFVDDQQGRATVEAVLDAVEEVGEDGRRGAGPNEPFGLESLDFGFAQTLGFGVQQPPPRATHGVGRQCLLEGIGLQQDAEAGDGPLGDRGRGEGGQGRPQMLLQFRGDGHRLPSEEGRDPLRGPGALAGVIDARQRLQGDRFGHVVGEGAAEVMPVAAHGQRRGAD